MKWQTNDAKQYWLNPNCFEKKKCGGAFLKNFLPQSYIRSSQPRLQLTGGLPFGGNFENEFVELKINIK